MRWAKLIGVIFILVWLAITSYHVAALFQGETRIVQLMQEQNDINDQIFRRLDAEK